MKNENKRKKNRKKLVFFLLMVAIILLTVIAVKTDIFYIKEIIVKENIKLSKNYIVDASDITREDNIFHIEINVKERKGKISYDYNKKKYLLDFDGVVLENIQKDEELFVIKSELETNIILGKTIRFNNKDIN